MNLKKLLKILKGWEGNHILVDNTERIISTRGRVSLIKFAERLENGFKFLVEAHARTGGDLTPDDVEWNPKPAEVLDTAVRVEELKRAIDFLEAAFPSREYLHVRIEKIGDMNILAVYASGDEEGVNDTEPLIAVHIAPGVPHLNPPPPERYDLGGWG